MSMKTIFILLSLLFSFSSANAGFDIIGFPGMATSGLIVSEDFEGSGTPDGWTVSGSGIDFDYSTSPAPLSGSESMAITVAWSTVTVSFDSASFISVKFEIYKPASLPTSSSDVMYWRGSGADQGRIFLQSNGRFGAYHGTAVNYGSASTLATDDAKNFLWIDFNVSSGSDDGTIDFYIAATDSKPGSPAMQITAGTSTTNLDSIRFTRANSGLDLIIDNLGVDDASID